MRFDARRFLALALVATASSSALALAARTLRAIDSGAPPATALRTRLDPNVATREEILLLDGIGPGRASAILARRREIAFHGAEDLLSVPGVGPATLERIRDDLAFGSRRDRPRQTGDLQSARALPPATMEPSAGAVESLVRSALEEDLGAGDLTTDAVVDAGAEAVGTIVTKEDGTLAGSGPAALVFQRLDPAARIEASLPDGSALRAGDRVLVVRGKARALLTGERTALNLLGRLSGIATLTARFVDAVKGTGVAILDTRKTTPGLRALEKLAIAAGGGVRHRSGLHDGILLKSNHYALSGRGVEATVARARGGAPEGMPVIAEARTVEEAIAAVRGGAGVVLLDNFDSASLRGVVSAVREEARRLGRSILLEASGGISIENARAFAESGVDRLSVGSLTHSARWLDLAMRSEPLDPGRPR